MDDETTQWTHEGKTRLRVPRPPPKPTSGRRSQGPQRGPARSSQGMFYNPAMRFARDLSVLFIEQRMHAHTGDPPPPSPRPYRIFDALAATGARTIRLAQEAREPTGVTFEAVACDRDPRVHALLAQNVAANRVAGKVAALREDMHRIATQTRFDHVDIDPFGSPAPFLDSAMRCLKSRGTIALTATDTAALTGNARAACRRRYHAEPWHGQGMHEAALRILAGAAVRQAARHDIAMRPILCHATDHYVRIYLQAQRGARRCDTTLASIGHITEQADGTIQTVKAGRTLPTDTKKWAGPMWIAPLHEPQVLKDLHRRLEDHPELNGPPLLKFLERALKESEGPPLYYEIGNLARTANTNPPPLQYLLEKITETGHHASRPHTSDTGLKTDMPHKNLVELLKDANG